MIDSKLKRDTESGKIAGVCAGIAQFFGWEIWVVRILAVAGFLFSGPLFFFGYIALWIILEKKSKGAGFSQQFAQKEPVHIEIKSSIYQKGEAPKAAFREIKAAFDELETRLRRLERHVTSKQFTVERQINKL